MWFTWQFGWFKWMADCFQYCYLRRLKAASARRFSQINSTISPLVILVHRSPSLYRDCNYAAEDWVCSWLIWNNMGSQCTEMNVTLKMFINSGTANRSHFHSTSVLLNTLPNTSKLLSGTHQCAFLYLVMWSDWLLWTSHPLSIQLSCRH